MNNHMDHNCCVCGGFARVAINDSWYCQRHATSSSVTRSSSRLHLRKLEMLLLALHSPNSSKHDAVRLINELIEELDRIKLGFARVRDLLMEPPSGEGPNKP